ncbi:MAG: NADH-quinone oxidoreductase subunit A [Thermoguttaceae bacterium]
MQDQDLILPILLLVACLLCMAVGLVVLGNLMNPRRPGRVKGMPYESGMDPIHDTRRRFDIRFHLLAIAFLVFDVELLFLYPWAVTARPAKLALAPAAQSAPADASLMETADALKHSSSGRHLLENQSLVFPGVMVFIGMLTLGFIYDWRKGVFRWR